MIKNWTVKTKQIFDHGIKYQYKKVKNKTTGKIDRVKVPNSGRRINNGFQNHVNYLIDNKRASHCYSNIHILNDSAANIIDCIDKRLAYRKDKGLRGGGVSNYATSLVMSLPRDIRQPTPDEWRKIALYTVKKIAKENQLDFETLKNLSHIVVHDESASLSKCSHLHILISNVIEHKVIKGISQAKTTYTAKQSFNYSVKKLLNEDNRSYIPENEKVKDKPLFAARVEKAEKVMQLFKSFKYVMNDWLNAVIHKKDTFILSKFAQKSATAFNDFDNAIENPRSLLPDKVLAVVEELEEFKPDDDLPELPVYKNLVTPLDEVSKISPKINRKKRSNSAKPTLKYK